MTSRREDTGLMTGPSSATPRSATPKADKPTDESPALAPVEGVPFAPQEEALAIARRVTDEDAELLRRLSK